MRYGNIEAGKLLDEHHRFEVCTGACYLVVYIGYEKYKRKWLRDRMDKWDRIIHAFTKTVDKYFQESYAAVVCAI